MTDAGILERDPRLAGRVRRLVEAHLPERLHLFGSRGRGLGAPDGDYDLLTEGVAARNCSAGRDAVPCRLIPPESRSRGRSSPRWRTISVSRQSEGRVSRTIDSYCVAGPKPPSARLAEGGREPAAVRRQARERREVRHQGQRACTPDSCRRTRHGCLATCGLPSDPPATPRARACPTCPSRRGASSASSTRAGGRRDVVVHPTPVDGP